MTSARILRSGQFFGHHSVRREVPGFSLAEMVPELPPDDVPRHTHCDAHFVLLMEGPYISTARGADTVCAAPTLIYNPPGTTHRDRFAGQSGRFFTISIETGRLEYAADHVTLAESAAVFIRPKPTALAHRLVAESRRWANTSPLVAEGLCLELLASISLSRLTPEAKAPAWLLAARDLLHECCANPVTMAEIAAAVRVHPIHLARTFRRFYRCTPGEYLRRCRLERAARLLVETAQPVVSIALATGFADQSHFGKAFHRHFGQPPAAFRKDRAPRRVCF